MKVSGVEFRKPCAFLFEVTDEHPVFAKVNDLYIVDNRPVTYTTLYKTLFFNKHFHGYALDLSNINKVISLNNTLTSYHVRTIMANGQQVIVPKFKIAGVVR